MKNKITLAKVQWKKEKVFWRRTKEMYKRFGLVSFIIAFPFIFIGNYAFKLMHTLWESYLWIANRDRFRENMRTSCEILEKKGIKV